MSFYSVAHWPDGQITHDTHRTEDEARSVCKTLEFYGYGGNRKMFPVQTRVSDTKPDYLTWPADKEAIKEMQRELEGLRLEMIAIRMQTEHGGITKCAAHAEIRIGKLLKRWLGS